MKKLLYLAFAFIYSNAFAQTDTLFKASVQDIMNLTVHKAWQEAKISTASLSEEGLSAAPAMMRVVTAEQIRLRGYRSLADALWDLPDFKIEDQSTNSFMGTISMRGTVYQNRFVILLDGVRISSPTNEIMPIYENYPIHYAKQIEIVYGSSSSLYGADAMSGVINIISKDHDKKKMAFDANVQAGNYGFYNASLWLSRRLGADFTVSAAANFYTDQQADLSKFYDDIDVSHYEKGIFNTIFGQRQLSNPPKASYQAPLFAYSMWANIKNKDFSFSIFRNRNQASSSYGVTAQNTVYNEDTFYGHSISMANMKYSKSFGKLLLNTLLMGSIYEVSPESNFQNAYVGMEKGYKYGYGSQLKFQEDLLWQLNNNWQVVAGLTVDSYYATPKTTDLPSPIDPSQGFTGNYIGTDIPIKFFQVKYNNFGAFGQIRYHTDKLTLNLGSRFDYNTRFGYTFNPRIAFNYHPNRYTTLKLLYGSAFLAPSPLENFENFGSFVPDSQTGYKSFFMHLPNPNLQPILSKNVELNFRQSFGENFGIELGIYHTWISNLITTASDAATLNLYDGKFLGYPVSFIEININQGKQKNYGGTIQADWRKKFEKGKINLYAALSYVDGIIEDNINGQTKEIEAAMLTNFQFKTGVDIEWKKLFFSPRLIWVGTQKLGVLQKDTDRMQTVAGYSLLNVAFGYKVYKESAFILTLNNALDQRYRSASVNTDLESPYYLKGIPQQPLRIQVGLQIHL